ncbi:MAG: FAD-binding protein [Sandaracinaceae bacterium]|nr:FAD-binding protein [Sandaracinaceae bacterium]
MPEQLDSGPWLWEDWLGQQDALTTYFRPKSVAQLRAFMGMFSTDRLRIRGIGAGHSTTPVARPWRRSDDARRAGIVVRPDAMPLHLPDAAEAWWKPGVLAAERLFRVEAGATIETLNQRFFDHGLAFPNLGSYDAQTISGAIATGTHGTGMATAPLCDLVASIELLTFLEGANGKAELTHVRVEPKGGPTDRAKFDAASATHGMVLIDEDDAFYSCVVGLGFFGIVTAVTLRLTDAFWLDETQQLLEWETLSPQLPALADQDWLDFLVSTRPTVSGPGGLRYKCLVTTRKREPSLGWGNPRDDARRDRLLAKPQSDDRVKLTKQLSSTASRHPRLANFFAVETFEEEVKRKHRSASHHIFRTSIGDLVLASSAEVSLPFDDVVTAVEAILANNAILDAEGLHHTSPFGVRFSKASKHYLSMAYGRRTCTIEAPLLLYTKAGHGPHQNESSEQVVSEILKRFTDAMRAACPTARFHHGQRNWNTRADLEAYPKFAAWKTQYERFNAFGVFSNGLSEAWNLDP